MGTGFWINLAIAGQAISLAFLAHLIEIALWAGLFVVCGEFHEFATAYYHSAVNYTTLGYGDIIMSPSWRLLGPLEAADGALMFGVSTAMIFAVTQRLILAQFADLQELSPSAFAPWANCDHSTIDFGADRNLRQCCDGNALTAYLSHSSLDVCRPGLFVGDAIRLSRKFALTTLGDSAVFRSQPGSRANHYSLSLTRENIAPCGSWPLMIQPPPGTCMGPFKIFPPPDSTRLMAALIESTWK